MFSRRLRRISLRMQWNATNLSMTSCPRQLLASFPLFAIHFPRRGSGAIKHLLNNRNPPQSFFKAKKKLLGNPPPSSLSSIVNCSACTSSEWSHWLTYTMALDGWLAARQHAPTHPDKWMENIYLTKNTQVQCFFLKEHFKSRTRYSFFIFLAVGFFSWGTLKGQSTKPAINHLV